MLELPGTYGLEVPDLPLLFARHLTGGRPLDFAFGAGRSTEFPQGLGFDVIGMDIALPMPEQARVLDPGRLLPSVQEGGH